ncbi:hypothetical protein TrCOL_g9844 [Triparma columacea]|uniref:UbiA prenyltransferase n=1 Tax=Triparma columacea TaxID=722753 RepID=A0A9W7L7J1_9STRA|nr:hypothetical protein TrCOL_g9844 [Triparma columacea]
MSLLSILYASRPWSFTASLIPLLHLSLLYPSPTNSKLLTYLTWLPVLLSQACSNYVNTYTDYHIGVDSLTSSGGDRGIRDGHVTEGGAIRMAVATGALSFSAHWLCVRGDFATWIDCVYLAGVIVSVGYTASPLRLKYIGLGDLSVFLVFNPLLVSYYLYGSLVLPPPTEPLDVGHLLLPTDPDQRSLLVSAVVNLLPLTLLTVAILHGNNLRDIEGDRKAGVTTVAGIMGETASRAYYAALVIGCYLGLWFLEFRGNDDAAAWGQGGRGGGLWEGVTVTPGRMAWLTLPLAWGNLRRVWRGEYDNLDEDTAKMHTAVGGVVAGGIWIMGW